MKKSLFAIITLSLILTPFCFAQKKNGIQQAMEAMRDSKIVYSLKELNKPIPVPDRTGNLTTIAYQEKTDKGTKYKVFKLEGEAKKVEHAAELDFENKHYADAREKYKRVMLIDPSQTWMMTLIAQTYGFEGKLNEAESWYKKSIEANYIDYLAHWMISDIYMLKGDKKKALQEISIAKVLNRNNPRLEQKRKTIYAANGLEAKTWTFNPQVRIEKTTPNNITVSSDTVWTVYAIVKTAWEMEPGYREMKAQTLKNLDLETLKNLECLEGLIGPNEQKEGIEVIERLKKALSTDQVHSFIFFEIELLDHPEEALYLSKEQIQRLVDYQISTASI